MLVIRDTRIVALVLGMCCYRIFVNVTTADFKSLSLHLIEEQFNIIVFFPHSLWQVIAIVCALRVFQLTKGFEFYFFLPQS